MRWTLSPLRRSDEAGASSLVTLLVSVVMFVSVFSVSLSFAAYEDDGGESGEVRSHAVNALQILTETPGQPKSWANQWASKADPVSGVASLGLRQDHGAPGMLDPDKFDVLRGRHGNPVTAEELPGLLGLEDVRMHVRAEPVYETLPNGTLREFQDVRTAYVMKQMHIPSTLESVALSELGLDFDPTFAGDATGAGVGDHFQDSKRAVEHDLTPRLAGFESASGPPIFTHPYWQVLRQADKNWQGWWTDLDSDVSRFVTMGGFKQGSFDPGLGTYSLTLGTMDLTNEDDAELVIDHWLDLTTAEILTADGLTTTAVDEARVWWRCVDACDGVDASTKNVITTLTAREGSKSGFVTKTVDVSAAAGREVILGIEYDRKSAGALDVESVSPGEGWFLSDFEVRAPRDSGDPRVVYENDLDFSTSVYDLLVIGSDVDHAEMNDAKAPFRHAIRDWVQEGGRLLVLGSNDVRTGWMADVVGSNTPVAKLDANSAASQADALHPLLTSPHVLRFEEHAHAVYVPVPTRTFETPLVRDTTAGKEAGTLDVSAPSKDFAGTVLVTSARPGGFAGPQGQEERFNTFVNWIAHLTRQESSLQVGELPPSLSSTERARAHASLAQPDGDDQPIVVTVTVWR